MVCCCFEISTNHRCILLVFLPCLVEFHPFHVEKEKMKFFIATRPLLLQMADLWHYNTKLLITTCPSLQIHLLFCYAFMTYLLNVPSLNVYSCLQITCRVGYCPSKWLSKPLKYISPISAYIISLLPSLSQFF
jgi:hypothetical protein